MKTSVLATAAASANAWNANRPIRGWMSWEKFTCETDCDKYPEYCISEHLVMTMADAMENEGLVAAGFTSVQIDDCWLAGTRDANGDLQADPKRFPRGIKPVADYVHSKGMQLGLYSDVGSATCCGLPSLNVSVEPNAKADAQLQRDAELLVSWGMDSLKVDGCNADTKGMNVTYPKLGKALKAAAAKYNRQAPWYSCSWPDYVGDQLCNHERKEPCVPLHQIAATCNSARLYADIADSWGSSIKPIIDFWAKNPQLSDLRNSLPTGTSYFNDPDQLMVGNRGLSHSEKEAQMGMWVMWAAPLILSTELRNGSMSARDKAILLNNDVLALADDKLGLQATQCLSGCTNSGVLYGGSLTVWNKTLADGSVAVALLNTGDFGTFGPSFGSFNASFTANAVGLYCGGPTPAPPSPSPTTYTHFVGAYMEPSPPNNIRCDAKATLHEFKSMCSADPQCGSFSFKEGNGGCLKHCASSHTWVNGSIDGYAKAAGSECPAPAPGGAKFKARDLFKNKDLGTFDGSFWSNVDESGMMLLRISCANGEDAVIV